MAVERQIEEMGRLRTANEELLRRVQTSIEQREAAVKAVRDELNGQLSTVRKELLQVHTENALLMSQLVRRVLVPLVALSVSCERVLWVVESRFYRWGGGVNERHQEKAHQSALPSAFRCGKPRGGVGDTIAK